MEINEKQTRYGDNDSDSGMHQFGNPWQFRQSTAAEKEKVSKNQDKVTQQLKIEDTVVKHSPEPYSALLVLQKKTLLNERSPKAKDRLKENNRTTITVGS